MTWPLQPNLPVGTPYPNGVTIPATTTGIATVRNSVWITYTPGDLTSATAFDSELSALRVGIGTGQRVTEVRFGKSISVAIQEADDARSEAAKQHANLERAVGRKLPK